MAAVIVSGFVALTPVVRGSDMTFRRYIRFRGLSSVNCGLKSSSPIRCSCSFKGKSPPELEHHEQGFSVLASQVPWEDKNIWSTFGVYMFCLHIPFSFGGLSILANIFHQKIIHPQTQVWSLVVLQMVELSLTLFLLKTNAKPQCKSVNLINGANTDSIEGRNWVVGSALGLGCIVGFIFITSTIADQLFGSTEAMHSSELANEEIVYRSGCFVLYCVVAPILEEIVYRRFLLSSLATRMKWWKALVMSSGVFALAHFSGEDFLQLFGIGCVLGGCYSWSGNLVSSVVVHSLYNALTLLLR